MQYEASGLLLSLARLHKSSKFRLIMIMAARRKAVEDRNLCKPLHIYNRKYSFLCIQ